MSIGIRGNPAFTGSFDTSLAEYLKKCDRARDARTADRRKAIELEAIKTAEAGIEKHGDLWSVYATKAIVNFRQ